MNEPELPQILKARLRLTLAQTHLPGQLRRTKAALIAWLDALATGSALPEREVDATAKPEHAFEIEAALTADFKRMTWRALGTPALIPAMSSIFDHAATDKDALAQFDKVLAHIQPSALGAWFAAYGTEVEMGWCVPSSLPLATALEVAQMLTPNSRVPTTLAAWANLVGAEQGVWLAHSTVADSPFTELRIRLPGDTVDDWVLAGVRLFDALKVVDLPDDALGTLLQLATREMLVSVWFTPRGVVKTGLMVAQPERDVTLDLFRMATGVRLAAESGPLAELQNGLHVTGPTWVEVQQRAAGFGVEYHYRLTAAGG